MDYTAAIPIFPHWLEPAAESVWNFVTTYPRQLSMGILLFCIGHVVFKKIIDPMLYDYYSMFS